MALLWPDSDGRSAALELLVFLRPANVFGIMRDRTWPAHEIALNLVA